jgi:hypothetical protein
MAMLRISLASLAFAFLPAPSNAFPENVILETPCIMAMGDAFGFVLAERLPRATAFRYANWSEGPKETLMGADLMSGRLPLETFIRAMMAAFDEGSSSPYCEDVLPEIEGARGDFTRNWHGVLSTTAK